MAGSTAAAKKDAMKLAAGANFNIPFVGSGSVSGSYAQGSDQQTSRSTQHSYEAMTWEAEGGETLLCSKLVSCFLDDLFQQ